MLLLLSLLFSHQLIAATMQSVVTGAEDYLRRKTNKILGTEDTINNTITETNRIPQTKIMVRSAYVRIKIHIKYEYAKRVVAAETEIEETA